MDLGGEWRAAAADEELRRAYAEPDFVDDAWDTITVPGHWRSAPAFAESDGPILHRHRFDGPSVRDEDRWWLQLDGVFYDGDVWLDGAYVGATEGFFAPHAFEVTEALAARREHVLAIEVGCAPQRDVTRKRNLTGVFQHWDCIDRDANPGGIWRPVRLRRTGPVSIVRSRVLCTGANEVRAQVAIALDLDATQASTVTLRTDVFGPAGDRVAAHAVEHPLAAGRNEVTWLVTVPTPQLWWPWALGAQALHDVRVTVEHAGDVSDERRVRTGLRTVSMHSWVCSVNGERLHLKGANHGPTRVMLGDASAHEVANDVVLARDAGLDLLRVHAHIARPELYETADRLGVLVWQDLPLQWGYARSVRRQAMRQAAQAVDLLGHHPSVALWCGHNEPLTIDVAPGGKVRAAVAARYLAGQQLPSWNRSVLDRSIARTLRSADSSRPVVAHSGVLPHLPQLDGTDSHLWFGWYHGDERDLPSTLRAVPRLARFVSEFGAQAVPDDDSFCEPDDWPDLDWSRLERKHALQSHVFATRVPPQAHDSWASWKEATQRYQATVVKHHVETLRRLKYAPNGGFCVFLLADSQPAVSWALLGHDRSAKEGYHALVDACRPVIVVADRLPEVLDAGDPVVLDVHVVSDLRHALEAARVTARLTWDGGSHAWAWEGTVGADSVVRVGAVSWVVPDAPGAVRLDLDLVGGDVVATNRYDATIG